MKFIVEGTMQQRGKPQAFVKEIEAASTSRAKELAYTLIGSDHALARGQVKIAKVTEMK